MKMAVSKTSVLYVLSLLVLSVSLASSASVNANFLECLKLQKTPIPIPIYSPSNSSYSALFNSSARNLRFVSATSQKPRFVITPLHESHVQAAVVCCRKHHLQLKVRSGGHDVEGQSYASDVPFVIADLINYRNITVDVENKTAWIQAGAQLGEVYYRVAEKSKTLGFPAGFCPTVGVGGHLSGGGFGALVRKYGLASDQVIDARMVNIDGKILDKESMGEHLYWAIRGGGAASFGVILSYKVNLVPVTENVTVATVAKTLEQNATSLVYKWQQIADKLPEDLYISLAVSTANSSRVGEKTVSVSFSILYLGSTDSLLKIMQERFNELGLQRKDCSVMSWVESTVYFYRQGSPLEFLLDRDASPVGKAYLKVKTDYVKEPISEKALEGIWSKFLEGDGPLMLWAPFGGKMNEISEYATPYPHRAGNLYNILYIAAGLEAKQSERQVEWLRTFYRYMAQYVSKFPRAAYLNYKDHDLGVHDNDNSMLVNSLTARNWGSKYFKGNFERLVYVKNMVDPTNFFKNKQSIPTY